MEMWNRHNNQATFLNNFGLDEIMGGAIIDEYVETILSNLSKET